MDVIVSPASRAQRQGLRVFLPISLMFHLLLFIFLGFLVPHLENPIPPLPLEVLLMPPVLAAQETPIPSPVLLRPPDRQASVEEKRNPLEYAEQGVVPTRKAEEETQLMEIPVPPVQRVETPLLPVVIEEPQQSPLPQKMEEERKHPVVAAIPESVVPSRSASEDSMPIQVASLTMEVFPSPALSAPRKESVGNPGSGDVVRQGEPPLAKLSPSPRGELTMARPRYAENPSPIYPPEARKKGYEGEVLLKVEVLADGRVGQIELKRSCGHAVLDSSALTAVKQWRFIPAKKGQNPVPLWVNIPIKFQLR